MEFKTGMVVVLKSGGPKMTITEINGEDIECQWFNEKNEVEVNTFNEVSLEEIVKLNKN